MSVIVRNLCHYSGHLTALALCVLLISIAPLAAQSTHNQPQQVRQVPQSLVQISLSFADLVTKTSPAVVNIYAQRRAQQRSSVFGNSLLDNLLGGFRLPRNRVQNSLGSGVIVDPKGLVVTNLHVLEGAEDIRVITHDKREYRAEVILADRKTDLSVIRLFDSPQDLPTLGFADAYNARVGDLVLAIGNPFGVSQTVTSGIISGLARSQVSKERYQSFIQTDAAINPGNSGGALIDISGKLLGINSAIISPSGVSSGLGFAVPVNMLTPLLYAARNSVPLNRAWLGFTPQAVDYDTADALGLEYPHGVLVDEPYPNSPADRAGLQAGDHIVRINNVLIEQPDTLLFYMATLIPETTPTVQLGLKDGRSVSLPVAFPPNIPAPDPYFFTDDQILSGANVVNISPFVAEHIGIPVRLSGVVINRLQQRSIAARVGFRYGDVIWRLAGERIENVAQLRQLSAALQQQPLSRLEIQVWRDGALKNWLVSR